MLVCLRSSRFMFPQNRDAPVFLGLRRMHNLDTPPGGRGGKKFVVTKLMPAVKVVVNKGFGTLNEARRYFLEEASKLEDQGMDKFDFKISGFHEED